MQALILKKTKLAEEDLIVTFLAEDGSLGQAVAKGARKPGGSLAARLELFTLVDLMLARGRTLDIVSEARLAQQPSPALLFEQLVSASPLAELLCILCQSGLVAPRIFDLSCAAFAHISEADNLNDASVLSSASLWKALAQSGFRPRFASCISCGKPLDDNGTANIYVLSVLEGGIVCTSCSRPADAVITDADTLRYCDAFIRLRFDDLRALNIARDETFNTLQLAGQWIRVHTGKNLKSLDSLLTSL